MASIRATKRAASTWRSARSSPYRPTTTRCWPRAWRCSRACTPRRQRGGEAMLMLSRRDVFALLTLDACIDAVERAFRHHADGNTLGPAVLSVPAATGSFHVKAAGLGGDP